LDEAGEAAGLATTFWGFVGVAFCLTGFFAALRATFFTARLVDFLAAARRFAFVLAGFPVRLAGARRFGAGRLVRAVFREGARFFAAVFRPPRVRPAAFRLAMARPFKSLRGSLAYLDSYR